MENIIEARVSNEVCSLNFSFLQTTYGSTYGIRQAKMLLNQSFEKGNIDLGDLLRHHQQRKLRGIEIHRRQCIDELLNYYSILEIAVLIGYTRFPPIGPQFREVFRHLSTPSLFRYYHDYYPLELPEALLRRYDLKIRPYEAFEPHIVFPSFISFLLLSQELNDRDIKAFLQLLEDSSENEGVNPFDVKGIILDKEKLWKVLGLKQGRGTLYKEARGFAKCIEFSKKLDAFLESISIFPLFQSACYRYHKPWYRQFGKQLAQLCTEMSSIAMEDSDSNILCPDTEFGVAAISRLISEQYAEHYEPELLG